MVVLGGGAVSYERGTPVGRVRARGAAGPPETRNPFSFTEMCSDSEAGSYSRLIDFLYHSTLGLRVIKRKKRAARAVRVRQVDPSSSSSLMPQEQKMLKGHLPRVIYHRVY